MCSSFDDISSLYDDDLIRFFDGLESMCNDDDGTSFEERIECFSDRLF
jgi:hypothetical protein